MSTKKTVRDVIIDRVLLVTEDKDLKFSKKQIESIMMALQPSKSGGGNSVKLNEDGDVYCNYFKTYLSPTEFKKTPQDKWPPMCIRGTKLRAKLVTLDKQMNKEISEAFLKGTDINKAELIAKYDLLKKNVDIQDTTEDKPKRGVK